MNINNNNSIYIKSIINNCPNICLLKSKNSYRLLYFDFNPFMFYNESFYIFKNLPNSNINGFLIGDIINKKYIIYDFNSNFDSIVINDNNTNNNLLLLSFLHNNIYIL